MDIIEVTVPAIDPKLPINPTNISATNPRPSTTALTIAQPTPIIFHKVLVPSQHYNSK